jgi:uncharacterized membrane protein YraQ (UPF0718 family)
VKFRSILKKNKILFIASIAYLIVLIYDVDIFFDATNGTWTYILEMIQILPAVFIITGLIDVWVSKKTIMKYLGRESKIKGKLGALLIGSCSAGPIYAAFPICHSLLKKGASLSNIVVILSAWAVIKIPMLFVEMKFLGIEFMTTRYILTVPGVLLIGMVTERFVDAKVIIAESEKTETKILEDILESLPGYNCGSCGYKNCAKYAEAIINNQAQLNRCKPGGSKISETLEDIFSKN